MTRSKPLDPDQRRDQLVAAARRVFAERGYHAASVADILELAGVARGTFYNYFESKRSIFQAVLEAVMADVTAAVFPIDVSRPIASQVRDETAHVVRALAALGPELRVLFADAAGIDAEGIEALNQFYDRAAARIEKALRTGQELGIVRGGDVRLMALLVLGMLREPVWQAILRREAIDAERLVDEIFALLASGILTR